MMRWKIKETTKNKLTINDVINNGQKGLYCFNENSGFLYLDKYVVECSDGSIKRVPIYLVLLGDGTCAFFSYDKLIESFSANTFSRAGDEVCVNLELSNSKE